MDIKNVCLSILEVIEEDEKEYCFDKSYISDEQWSDIFGSETREESFDRVMTFWRGMLESGETYFIDAVLKNYGDEFIRFF